MGVSSQGAANAVRDQHVIAKLNECKSLVAEMGEKSPAFLKWEAANKAYEKEVTATAHVGTSANKRSEALHAVHIARLEYLAPLAIATEKARTEIGHPPLLSPEDWVELAFHEDASLLTLKGKTPEEFKQAVDESVQRLKDKHKALDGLISADQLKEGQELAEKSRKTFTGMIERGANWLYGRRIRSSMETKLGASATDADILPEHLDRLINAQAVSNVQTDPGYANKSDAEKKQLLDDEVAKLKKDDSEFKKQAKAEINENRARIKDDFKFSAQAYSASVTDMTTVLESSLNAVTVYKKNLEAYNKNNQPGVNLSFFADVSGAALAARLEEEKSIMANYHEHARHFEEQFVKAGKMGRFDAQMHTSRKPINKEQSDKLEGIKDNAERKKKGEPMLVNGIPCEHTGSANMYDMDIGTRIMGVKWGGGKRTQHIGKFFEGWMVETTAANNDAYQKMLAQNNEKPAPLSVSDMLKAYSDKQAPSNQNMVNGQPVNMLHVTSFPVHNGVQPTMEALAEMMAMAKILGVAINIDMDAIVHNAHTADQGLAKRIQYEMLKYLGPNDKVYYLPALKKVREEYQLTGSEDAQREQLIERLSGKSRLAEKTAMTMTQVGQSSPTEGAILTGTTPSPTPGTTPPVAASGGPLPPSTPTAVNNNASPKQAPHLMLKTQ